MMKFFVAFLLTTACIGCVQAESLSCAEAEKGTIIDVRTSAEFKTAHIKGAINIPHNLINSQISEVKELTLESPIFLYCRSGRRAENARQVLTARGFKYVKNCGGYYDLREEIKKSTP